MIRGGRLRYNAYFLKKNSVELPFSSFGDHLINILAIRITIFDMYYDSYHDTFYRKLTIP
jgi:hypothetical protein